MPASGRLAALLLALSAVAACGSGSAGPTGPTPGPGDPGGVGPPMIGAVRWAFDDDAWRASGTPPECPSPLTFATPADFSRATSVLYPGQIRGNAYRPHGGLRFDAPGETGNVAVVAPMDGSVSRGARYLEGGALQYTFDIVHDCGILHRFDHLRDLVPLLQQLADLFPPAREGDSRTTPVAAGRIVRAGERLAAGVGDPAARNVFFDWGVYDVRRRNDASQNGAWLAAHPGAFASYAICWFDNLPPGDAALVRSLPPGSSESGAISDYCR